MSEASPLLAPDQREVLLQGARAQLDAAVALRRQLHRYPELGLELPKTKEAVLAALDGLDLAFEHSKETSGFVARLDGARPGKRLLLRADMDALPMPEDTGLEFASSVPGAMHACGHDAHTAMLVGAAHLLSERAGDFAGSVSFMFQPGEEGHFGALRMIDEGLLGEERAFDGAFAIHITPQLPCGVLASRVGAVLAAADIFDVELRGRGGHASMPQDTIDPIPVACEIVQALQSFVTRRVPAFDPVVLTVAKIESGTTYNVVPETAKIQGTLRSVSERSRSFALDGLERVIKGVAAAHEVEATVRIERGYPVTVNDAGFVDFMRDVARDLLGDRGFITFPSPMMGAEDFSYVLQRATGALAFLGVAPEGGGSASAPCHSNRMMLNEEGMVSGMAMHAAVALAFLG